MVRYKFDNCFHIFGNNVANTPILEILLFYKNELLLMTNTLDSHGDTGPNDIDFLFNINAMGITDFNIGKPKSPHPE